MARLSEAAARAFHSPNAGTPSSSSRSPPSARKKLEDPRRASKSHAALERQISPEELKMPLPAISNASRSARKEKPYVRVACKMLARVRKRLAHALARAAARLCAAREEADPDAAPRRWYRVYPISDTRYFVRPDAGMAGRVPGYRKGEDQVVDAPGVPSVGRGGDHQLVNAGLRRRSDSAATPAKKLPRNPSVPAELERRIGVEWESLHGENMCKICFDRPCGVVVLPCRHGGMCEQCIRRSIFSKPAHRGGRDCPLCRRTIREVVRVYDKSYGYALRIDSFAQ